MDLSRIIERIDKVNVADPNLTMFNGKEYPKELLYSIRMTEMLKEYVSKPSDAIQIAARGQHVQRWAIPRSDYPMDKSGYMKWRTVLKTYHAELVGEILEDEGVGVDIIDRVKILITKRKLITDEESKVLEDVVCLVFLKFHFSQFAAKHPAEKVIDIVRKTWAKMTNKGHEVALKLPFESDHLELIKKAIT